MHRRLRLPLLLAFPLNLLLTAFLVISSATPAAAQDRLCDPAAEDCRRILIDLIRNENVGLDVAFWFMEDARYTAELIRRHRAGVPVRVLIDTRANAEYPLNADRLRELRDAGIPMRRRVNNYILHWKMMLFHGQNVVQFSGANYSANAWVPLSTLPFTNYIDEAIYFTADPGIVNSFRTTFEDQWVADSGWADYANITRPLTRRYPIYEKDPSLNFPPSENYRTRSINLYKRETYWIDAIMYRITDRRHTDTILEAVQRGVSVRLITEPDQYRDKSRLWHAWNVDRLYMGGVQIRHRAHAGLNHQKSVILYGQKTVIFGSSNWTSPSAAGQLEHNLFTTKPELFNWFAEQFARKWNNLSGYTETQPFTPLPPDAPASPLPADRATNVPATVTLQWVGGPWAHLYDVYIGTDPNALTLYASNLELGPSEKAGERQSYQLPIQLARGTTYYWRVVGKTMAMRTASSPIWRFTVTTELPPAAPTLITPATVELTGNPTFSWSPVPRATHYQLWIEDRTGVRLARWYGAWLVGCGMGTGTCSVTPGVPLTPGPIAWWVQAWNELGGYGEWSAAARFIQLGLTAPTLLTPVDILPEWPSITFQWPPVPGATHYRLWLSDGLGIVRIQAWYTSADAGCDAGVCRIRASPQLSPGRATWWVQGWNATVGEGPWSAPLRFVRP